MPVETARKLVHIPKDTLASLAHKTVDVDVLVEKLKESEEKNNFFYGIPVLGVSSYRRPFIARYNSNGTISTFPVEELPRHVRARRVYVSPVDARGALTLAKKGALIVAVDVPENLPPARRPYTIMEILGMARRIYALIPVHD